MPVNTAIALPYFVRMDGRSWCVVPYSLETNDMKFWRGPGFATARHFFEYLGAAPG